MAAAAAGGQHGHDDEDEHDGDDEDDREDRQDGEEKEKEKDADKVAVSEDAATAAKYSVRDEAFETRQLDELLQYLWVVHGVDYYACKEYGTEGDTHRRAPRCKRMVRPSQLVNEGDAVMEAMMIRVMTTRRPVFIGRVRSPALVPRRRRRR